MKRILDKLNLRAKMTFFVMLELLFVISAANGLSVLVHTVLGFGYTLPRFMELLLISTILGAIITGFMVKGVLEPVEQLKSAMNQVSKGQFNTELPTNKGTKEIRRLNTDFNLMVKELRATEVLQTDFVSNVSHEFKTPINAIEGYATLLQDHENLSCEEETQYVEKILYNTKRLSGLVGNILLLSKIENQAIQTHQTSFRLDEQIRQSIVILEPEWVKKDIEFDVEMEDIELISSENLLYHVWNNLIGNAIKFSPDGGIIHLRLFSDSDGILFSVQDHGPGISEESQKHIFDKFYQADSSHKQEGNGLGLALVKKILHLCGGEVSAENVPEGGCRFTVRMKQNAVIGSL